MKLTLDQALLRKFQGWDMKEFLFVSVIGDLSFLRNFTQLERCDDYAGIRDMSVIIVCSRHNPTEAYREAEKMIAYGVSNVGIWIIGDPTIREIAFNGWRPLHEGTIFLDQAFQGIVNQFVKAAA